jgi:catechol 2,3-dioxygenase-like lactoylglutathione lyase family enzyme
MAEQVYGLDHVQLAMPRGGEPLARRFYGDLLAPEEIPKPPNLAVRGGVWFQCGAAEIHLGVEEGFRPAKKAHPAFLVRNLKDILETLNSAGFDTAAEPGLIPGCIRAFTADPFGNRIELVQRLEPDH